MENKNIYNILQNTSYKIYNQKWIKAIREGLLKIQPLILVNCLLLIFLNISIRHLTQIFQNIFGDKYIEILYMVYNNLHMMIKVLLVATVSYSLAKSNKKVSVPPILVAMVGLLSVFILTTNLNINVSISNMFNATWSFYSVILVIIFSELFIYIYSKTNNKLNILEGNYDKSVKESMNAFLPSLIIIFLVFILKNIIENNYENILDFAKNISLINNINPEDGIVISVFKYLIYSQIYWFFGGHGGDIIEPLGFSKLFINIFCNIGGAGSTICLIIAILICNVNKYRKSIAKICVPLGIFNINEVVTYSMPVIFNPIYIIPFIFTPLVLSVVTYIWYQLGLIEQVTQNMSWMTPVILNSYQVTGSFNGVILQIINIIIGVGIYIPFVKIQQNIDKKEEERAFNNLKSEIFKHGSEISDLENRDDNVGQIANFLSIKLRENLDNNESLYLEYQPQVNKDEKVVGVEALLRWKNKDLGNIPPIVTVVLAEQTGQIYDLGKWIIKEACSQLAKWNNELGEEIDMSINVSSIQLTDDEFVKFIKKTLKMYKLNPRNIKLEITESLAIGEDETTVRQLKELSNLGVKLAIDDFGVGYNPILYITKYNIYSIKIDGSLIRDIDTNQDSKNIVQSIYNLCDSSDLEVVNEFVETNEQKKVLDNMGDGLYQGYLFSRPLGSDECLKYIKQNV